MRKRRKRLTWRTAHRLECAARREPTMRKIEMMLFLTGGILLAGNMPAGNAQESKRSGNSGVTGTWIVDTDYFGTTIYYRMELKQDGEKLTGNFDGDKLEGTLKGNAISFLAKDE